MKLEQLTIDGAPSRQPIQLVGFSNGLNFVYGENSSGKSSIGRFLRSTLFPNHAVADSTEFQSGRSRVTRSGSAYDLHRLPNQTTVQPIGNANRVNTPELIAGVTPEIYDAIFNFSFKNTPRNANRLANVLHHQLSVPTGVEGSTDGAAIQAWSRQQESLRLQLSTIESNTKALTQEKSELLRVQSSHEERQRQVALLDTQISDLQLRIGSLNSSSVLEQLSQIEAEIQTLRLRIDNARTEVIYPVAEKGVDHGPLYAQLDELENQIRRWRHVQTDVQNQRIRLRDEMLVWNELTLDSDEHPYHNAREILVRLESKVDQAERSANHWADVGNSRVDTEQFAESLGQLCQTMRDDLYGLCSELAHQYKHLRHKAAATELKQLRRCYTEMGENIERLVQRRAGVIKEIRQFDPAGAEAIARSDAQFCQCAQHEGYLEARKRFVGPMANAAPQPVRIEPDLKHERSRLSTLESERAALLAKVSDHDAEDAGFNRQLADLTGRRDAILNESALFDAARLSAIGAELTQLENQRTQVLAQISQPKPQPTVNPILSIAAEWLPTLTNGEISKAYIGLSTVTGDVCLQALNSVGQAFDFDSFQPSTQDQIYLSLVLAAKEHLRATRSVELPTLIDDSFSRISGDRITPTFELLTQVSRNGNQIVLLSQHRYIADRAPGITILHLDGQDAVQKTAPQLTSTPMPMPTPLQTPNAPAAEPDLREQVSFAQVSQNLAAPYPLSKYRRNDEVLVDQVPRIYAAPQDLSGESSQQLAPNASSRYAAVPVANFAQPLPIEGSVSESSSIAVTGFFDSADIRFLENHGLSTVGDLLGLSFEAADQIGVSEELLEEWQTGVLLMVCVPSLQPAEARTLAACGISSPQQMSGFHARDLYDRVQRLLNTNHRQRNVYVSSISFDRVLQWMEGLDRTRSRWQGRSRSRRRSSVHASRPNYPNNGQYTRMRSAYDRDSYDRPRQERSRGSGRDRNNDRRDYEPRDRYRERRSVSMPPREDRYERPARPKYVQREESQRRDEKTAPAIAPIRSADRDSKLRSTASSSSKSGTGKLKFYLNLDDQLEAAPSIGPKTAERFEKIGVVTVSDFLKQTAESMAEKLNYKRISADVIRQWQHQARLNCRVPNLRGHDVQLLVGIDITEPEELATMQPQNLLEKVSPFAESKEGLKIIRSGKQPDLAEITDWITWAAENRSIQAA